MSIFKPYTILNNYHEFDMHLYRSKGFDTILLDIDNTLVPYYAKEPDQDAIDFINNLNENGFNVILQSNNIEKRVGRFAKNLNCKYYCLSLKPLPFSYNKIFKENNFDRNKTICMGDQLLTDTLGANLNGLKCIYVKPLVNKDSWDTKLNRKIERFIFKNILHEEM